MFVYDNFKTQIKCPLNAEDHRSLTLLYLPLMGIDSYVSYCVLMSLDEKEIYTYKKILDLLNFTNIKNIIQAIEKLEGLGLVRSYHSDNKPRIYQIIPPLSPQQFFENELLFELLKAQIGETELNKYFSKSNKKVVGYKDVTKKFNDIYDIRTTSITKTLNKLIKPQINVENQEFNYSLFKILFNETIADDVLDDETFKHRIVRISFLYKLNEEEMHDVVIKTMDIDKSLEYASISKNARYTFQNKYKVKSPKLETKHDDSFLTSVHDDEHRDILNLVENRSIADVLESISGIKPAVSEIKVFEDLMNNTDFTPGVINLMILYINAEKEGELPSYNYFEKIANTWARAKVKTSYDVLKYLEKKNQKQETNKQSFSKSKKVKPVPEWYNEYEKELHKNKNNEMSSEKEQELKNIVKDLFG